MLKPTRWYLFGLGLAFLAFCGMLMAWIHMVFSGMHLSGKNNPVGWAFYITNFVFWVGIAHSGTLISAVLYLFRTRFRSRFNRAAEAMTLFAVMVAGLFPMIHLGRLWVFFYTVPYPNQRQIWPNFRSPLIWDVFAVSTYFTVSLIFWYLGLVPDLAIARRRTTGIARWIYSSLSLGWSGTTRQWKHYNKAYGLLACFATPLVVSVHSVVSWDFAMGIVPGWHSTIFPPYFVAGAIFSGCAMVLTIMIPMRKWFKLESVITVSHMESLSQMLLLTSMIVTYSYIVELAMALYSGNIFEKAQFMYRMGGYYAVSYWIMIFCNCIVPLTIFWRKARRNLTWLFILSIFVNIGMWLERFNIIVQSLSHEFDPYAWGRYHLTYTDVFITIGAFGMFFMLFLIFAKTLPVLPIWEVKEETH